MSALIDPSSATRDELVREVATLRTALAQVARIPGAAAWIMDTPRAWEQARRCAEAEEEFEARRLAAAPRTAVLALEMAERCEALSEEFAAREAASREEGFHAAA